MPNPALSRKCIVNNVVSTPPKQSRLDKPGVLRFGSIVLIVALLAQVMLIVPVRRANARGINPTSPLVSAPIEQFVSSVSRMKGGATSPAIIASALFTGLSGLLAEKLSLRVSR